MIDNSGAARSADGPEADVPSHAPLLVYLVAALATLGLAAGLSSWNVNGQELNTDIWQHAAALQALMDDLADPQNPFVASDDTSRHFHPLWVGAAATARALGLSAWEILAAASFVSMAILAAGIYSFARVFYASPWGPVVLLMTMMAGWAIQPHHTGYHSFHTLLFGAPYPATTMIGLGLLLWTLTIRSLSSMGMALLLVPLTAFMFATHQLGAVIGLIGAGCFILFWPLGEVRLRVLAALAILLGLGASLFWPYHNPAALVLSPGNSDWEGGPDFFDPAYVALFTLPIAIGVVGLRDARGRAILAALAAFAFAYAVGIAGPQVTGRFVMPITLCLHIGVASLILQVIAHPRVTAVRPSLRVAAVGAAGLVWLAASIAGYIPRSDRFSVQDPSPYAAALTLTADIPNGEEVAAYDLAAWPVVATGQRVHSIPWPEPGIPDLAARQDATKALFDTELPADQRRAQAEALGIRTLIADTRITPRDALATLSEQAAQRTIVGTLVRFDLVE